MTLIGIILGLLLIYYTIVSITFLISTGLFKVILSGLVVMILFAPIRLLTSLMKIIDQDIIIAPHTFYDTVTGELKDAFVTDKSYSFDDTEYVKFVQPDAWQIDEDFEEIVSFARQMSTLCEFVDDKQSRQIQQQLNSIIRAGLDIDELTLEALAFANQIDMNVLRLWSLVRSIKADMLFLMRNNGPKAFIGDRQCGGEGYVRVNDYGMFKLVNREQFSHANFNNGRFACAS